MADIVVTIPKDYMERDWGFRGRMLVLVPSCYVSSRPVLPQFAIEHPDDFLFDAVSRHIGDGHIDLEKPCLCKREGLEKGHHFRTGKNDMLGLGCYELPVGPPSNAVAPIGFSICGSDSQFTYDDGDRGEIVEFAANQPVFPPLEIDKEKNSSCFSLDSFLKLPKPIGDDKIAKGSYGYRQRDPRYARRFHKRRSLARA